MQLSWHWRCDIYQVFEFINLMISKTKLGNRLGNEWITNPSTYWMKFSHKWIQKCQKANQLLIFSRSIPITILNECHQDLKFFNCLIKCFGILIVVANLHVLCPQMKPPNKSIGVDLDSLNQMEKASSFLIGQWLGWISKWVNTIHTTVQFTWALSTMNHLYFGIWIPFAFMTFTKGPPHKYLILQIFWL